MEETKIMAIIQVEIMVTTTVFITYRSHFKITPTLLSKITQKTIIIFNLGLMKESYIKNQSSNSRNNIAPKDTQIRLIIIKSLNMWSKDLRCYQVLLEWGWEWEEDVTGQEEGWGWDSLGVLSLVLWVDYLD